MLYCYIYIYIFIYSFIVFVFIFMHLYVVGLFAALSLFNFRSRSGLNHKFSKQRPLCTLTKEGPPFKDPFGPHFFEEQPSFA